MFFTPFNRRDLLKDASLIAMASSVPAFLRQSVAAFEPKNNGRILVVIQLSGGNDGINTVVPYADEGYAKLRHELRLSTDRLIKLDDLVGLHPALRPMAELLEDGRLAIVQGVGYPNPNRSHEVSMAIWQTARIDPEEHKTFGWIGRTTDQYAAPVDGSPHSMLLGDENTPIALRGRRSTSVSLASLDDLRIKPGVELRRPSTANTDESLLAFARRAALDALSTADLLDSVAKRAVSQTAVYPSTKLASRLMNISQLIQAGSATPVYYAIHSSFDTHAAQLPAHSRLLGELAGAMKAFLDDLKNAGLAERVIVLCFSEFGRRPQENASLGTDHGTSGPVLVAGQGVKPGLIGHSPSMTNLVDGDLKMQFDFRQVYATILEDWLGVESTYAIGGEFDRLGFVKRVVS